MSSTWLRPPVLQIGGGEDESRSATWLELFFDLVFVVAVAELAHTLDGDITGAVVLEFVALFVPIWWVWIGSTFYASRFDTDDLEYRFLTAIEMGAVAALAVNIHGAFADLSVGFALSYATVRGVLVVKYLRARRHVPEARPLTTRFAAGFGIDAIIWFASVLVPPPFRYGLWILGLLISFGTPIFAGQLHGDLPPHQEHLPERFGLFTIIVLGESIVAVVGGLADQTWTLISIVAGGASLTIAFSLWWLYFENLDGSAIRAAQEGGRTGVYQRWLYAHFPLVVGLAAAGVGVEHILTNNQGVAVPVAERWLLCGALALCLFALGAIYQTADVCADRDVRMPSFYRLGAGVVILVIGLGGVMLTPLALLGLLALACAIPTGLDFREQYTRQSASETGD